MIFPAQLEFSNDAITKSAKFTLNTEQERVSEALMLNIDSWNQQGSYGGLNILQTATGETNHAATFCPVTWWAIFPTKYEMPADCWQWDNGEGYIYMLSLSGKQNK